MTNTTPGLPNPFLDPQIGLRPRGVSRIKVQPALAAFLICLVLGLATAAWRGKTRADDAHARASLEALAHGSTMELQLGQAITAAEMLGTLARLHGGAVPDFQKVAAELLAARPGLASLELQAGGVVSDIVPRPANARVIGFNVLSDPAYRPGASAAIQRRALTVSGPLTLYSGEPGIVARVPVFLRGRDGREAFWGFVAASMRLSEALARAQAGDLAKHGYNYALVAPASGREKGVTIAARGAVSAQGAVQQPVRAGDLTFRLLLQPRGGWITKTKLMLECLGVLAVSGLICLLVNLLESRRALEASLGDANQRLARETEVRKRAQEDCHAAKDKVAATQAELSRAQSAVQSGTESEVRLTVAVRAAEAAAQATQTELDQARVALQQAEQTIASLQSRLRAAARARKETEAAPPTPPQQDPPTFADVPAPVDAAASSPEQTTEPNPDTLSQVAEPHQEPSAPPDVSDPATSTGAPAFDTTPIPAAAPEPETPEPPAPTPALLSEPPAEKKPTKPPRRKKARPDNQMDFFAPQPTAEPAPATPPATPLAEEPAVDRLPLSAVETPPPPAALEAEEPEQPAADAPERTAADAKPKEPKPPRPLPARPPLDLAQLRKAVNLILPLFTGRDPGARDCLKDNRTTFRSAFAPEAYLEFEQSVKSSDFDTALEHLKKAAKRHGIPV